MVAAQMLSSIVVPGLVAMTFAFDQASSIDLALVLALLCLPGSLLYALFSERWL
jgi:multicomponent Na+:H+ antiporter subunit F